MNIKKIIREEVNDFDWAKEITLSFSKDVLPRVGDTVKTLPGFTKNHDDDEYDREDDDPNCGGYGYKENRTIVVRKITHHNDDRPVIWPEDNIGGIYADALGY